jgi:hypothetical protein
MGGMRLSTQWRSAVCLPVWPAYCLLAVVSLAGCKKLHQSDMTPLNRAGMDVGSLPQLRKIGVSDSEVVQLASMRQSGLSDDGCLQLVRLAHDRHEPFTDGQGVAGLLGAGLRQDSVMELAKLDQLGLWTGEAEVLRLSGLSDQVVLAVARRRAGSEPVLSSAKITSLKNAGLGEAQILADINSGMSDAQADKTIAQKNYAAGGHSFVHEPRRRRR